LDNNSNPALIAQVEQLASTVSAAAEMASAAAATASAAAEMASAAAATASTAMSTASEASAEMFEMNQILIDKIEYLFMMFYRSDSNAIMENYPIHPNFN
jgi:hypothetical protein